jgi:hypothetical protein
VSTVFRRIIDRYFIYRDRYVGYFREHVPARVGWAIASEVARLAFVVAGAALFALVFGFLTAAAAGSPGRRWWALPFALLAFWSLGSLVIAGRSLLYAIRQLNSHRQDC